MENKSGAKNPNSEKQDIKGLLRFVQSQAAAYNRKGKPQCKA
jgi:hypothetical protein